MNPILEAIIVLTTKQREMHYESVIGGRKGVLTKASSHSILKTSFESVCPKMISLGNIPREFRNH